MDAVVRFVLALAAITLALATPGWAEASNLVDNPGFETGDFTDWTVSGETAYTHVVSYPPYVNTGSYGAQFSGVSGDNGMLSQTLSTVPGQAYIVDFWLYSDGATPNSFSVTFDGISLFSQINLAASPYSEYSFTPTAIDSSATLQFTAYDNPGFFGLDDISVVPVPEPSALVLLAGGALGVAWAAIRRRARLGRLAFAAGR
ncbi:MAG TPA: carbohydrate binding domain-containing protein [Pirellulales bacterium]